MGILSKLETDGSKYTKYNGQTPAKRAGSSAPTGLHLEDIANPDAGHKSTHTKLDLDGKTPAGYIHPETGVTFG